MSSQGGNGEQEAASSSWWGWGDSLLQTVKKQSETIISIYKEDLSEFTRTIKEDTLSVVKEVVKQEESDQGGQIRPHAGGGGSAAGRAGISTSSSGLSNFFNFMETLKDEEEEEVLAKSRREKCVKKLQKDVNTYTAEPADDDDFKEWKAGFNLEARTVEISQLLSANPKLRAIHNELLPKLTYSVFWERYYYRLEKLLKEEERREKILMRAELENTLDDWGGWEDEEESQPVSAAEVDIAITADAGAADGEEKADEHETTLHDESEEGSVQHEDHVRGDEAEAANTPEASADEPTILAYRHTSVEPMAASKTEAPEETAALLVEDTHAQHLDALVLEDDAVAKEEEEEEEEFAEEQHSEDHLASEAAPAPAQEEEDWGAWE